MKLVSPLDPKVQMWPCPRIAWGCGDLLVPHVRYTVGSKYVSRAKTGCGTFGVDQRSLWQKLNIRSVSCGFGLLWPLLVWLTPAPWLMLRSMSIFFSLTLLIVHLRPIRYNSTSYLMPLMSVSKISTLFLFLVLFERSKMIAGSSLRLKFHCLLKSIVLKSCQFSVFH